MIKSDNRLLMEQDRERFGQTQEGEYRGIKWSAQLSVWGFYSPRENPKNNDCLNSHWCGYLHLDREPTEFDKKCMLKAASECTYHNGNKIGFDCNHCDDYPLSSKGVYHTFPMVKKNLEDMIDLILKGEEE